MTLEQIQKEVSELKEIIKEINAYIIKRDIVPNTEYCRLTNTKYPTLLSWFQKGCPRVDHKNVSIKEVSKWKSESVTKKK